MNRPRLLRRLQDVPDGGIGLLCAPAGFGKTTLVRAWCDRYGDEYDVSWLSFDAQDNQEERFMRYLSAAIGALVPSFSSVSLDTFGAKSGASLTSLVEVMLESLFEVVESGDSAPLLILDNVHLLTNARCHEALCLLLSHWPMSGKVLLCCRQHPPYPLLEWRVAQRLLEIDAIQLRLTFKETARLLQAYLELPEEEGALSDAFCERVYEKIGGWAAGLQLAMMSLELARSPDELLARLEGSQREVESYLGHEIFSCQPEGVRQFLSGASLFERWSVAMCDAALDRSDSKDIVALLLRNAIFVEPLSEAEVPGERALDDTSGWFTFASPLADFLRNEGQKQLSETERHDIFERGSQWLHSQDDLDGAIRYALAANEPEAVVSMLLQRGMKIAYQVDWDLLLRWLVQLPPMLGEQHPQLRLLQSYIFCMRGQWGTMAETELQRTERIVGVLCEGECGEERRRELDFMRGQIAFIRAHNVRNQGRLDEALKLSSQALSLIPETQRSFLSTAHFYHGFYEWHAHGDVKQTIKTLAARQEQEKTASAGSLRRVFLAAAQADALTIGGQLHQVARLCRQVLAAQGVSRESLARRPHHSVSIHIRLGQVLLQWNQLDEAAAHILSAHRHATDRLLWREAQRFHIYRILLHLARHELQEAQEIFECARAQQPPEQRGPRSLLDVYQARCWLRMGNVEAASHWAQESGFASLVADGQLSFQHETGVLTYARVLLSQGEATTAIPLLQRVQALAEDAGRGARVLESLVLQALAFGQSEATEASWESLLQALSQGRNQDAIRVFVDEGPPMKALLLGLLKAAYRRQQTGPTAYIQTLIESFPSTHGSDLSDTHEGGDMPVEFYKVDPLSDRELEILTLAATGEPYKRMANRLEISPATVKRHMNNIYSKLGVHSRNDAVAFARKMNILE